MYNHLYILLQLFPNKGWDWYAISKNSCITWDIVKENPEYPWSWEGFSANPNITWDIVQANFDKNWDWSVLSRNPCITWDIIKENPEYPWSWEGFSANPNITWDIVQANLDKNWDWIKLSCNSGITWNNIKNNPDFPWDWEELSWKITSKIQNENPEYPWCQIVKNYCFWCSLNTFKFQWELIDHWANPTLTWKIIKNNSDKLWNWTYIGHNQFNWDNAAIIIQRWWRRLFFKKWKKKIEYVNNEIKFSPTLNGVEFQKIKEEIMSMC